MAQNDTTLHIDVPLTDIATAYRPDEDGLIYSKMAPVRPVTNISNYIRSVDRAALMTIPEAVYSGQGRVGEVRFKMGASQLYRCVDYALEGISDRRERANADSIIQYDQELIYTVMVKMGLKLEKVYMDVARSTGNYESDQTLTLAAADQWDNDASPDSEPLVDIINAVTKVKLETGGSKRGSIRIAMHMYTWQAIQRHRRSLQRAAVHVAGNPSGIFTEEMFKKIVFGEQGVQGELIVYSARYNYGTEASEDMRSFIGPDVLIQYVEEAGPRAMGYMQSFAFSGTGEGVDFMKKELGGSQPLVVVYSYPDPARGLLGSDVHRAVGSVDFKVLYKRGGYLLKSVVDNTRTEYGTELQG